jgi:hypothetical protein
MRIPREGIERGMSTHSRGGSPRFNVNFTNSIVDNGIRHSFETYEGDHTSGSAERLEKKVLPFSTENLAFR